jgi:hypothetical protein
MLSDPSLYSIRLVALDPSAIKDRWNRVRDEAVTACFAIASRDARSRMHSVRVVCRRTIPVGSYYAARVR